MAAVAGDHGGDVSDFEISGVDLVPFGDGG